MRILHLSDNYPPSRGGLERSVQSLARVQVASGHRVAVATTQLDGEPDVGDEGGVEIHRLPFLLRHLPGVFQDDSRVFFPPVPEPVFERNLKRLLEEFRPDVVHIHGWILYSSLGPVGKSGAAIVATAHDYGSVCALKTLFRHGAMCSGPAYRKCLECASKTYGIKSVPIVTGMFLASRRHVRVDEWTAISTAVADAGSAPNVRDRREMVVIPSFVPDSVVEASLDTPRPEFVPPEGPYIFFAGALGAHKGVDVLLEAHRQLWGSGLEIPLVLAGMAVPGVDVDFDQPGVSVVTNVPHGAVMAGWVNATVGVVPSVWGEPFGQVAVECLAAGTPLVVSRVGGLTDIVDNGRCGLLVEPGEPDELAEAIRTLFDDEGLAERLASAGRERAKLFTASVVQQSVEESYLRAIDIHRNRLSVKGTTRTMFSTP